MQYGIEKTVYEKKGLVEIKVRTIDNPKEAVIYLEFPKSTEWAKITEQHNKELEYRLLDYIRQKKLEYGGINNVDWVVVPVEQLTNVLADLMIIVENYLQELEETKKAIGKL